MTLADYLTTGEGATLYAELIAARNDAAIAAAMSMPSALTAPFTRWVNARTVLAELGAAGAVTLAKIEGFVGTELPPGTPVEALGLQVAARYAMRFVESAEGIDLGHPSSRTMLDGLAPAVLTADEVAALKGLAERQITIAEAAIGRQVSVDDVSAVLNAAGVGV